MLKLLLGFLVQKEVEDPERESVRSGLLTGDPQVEQEASESVFAGNSATQPM